MASVKTLMGNGAVEGDLWELVREYESASHTRLADDETVKPSSQALRRP